MSIIFGKQLKKDQQIFVALTKIYGIGLNTAVQICQKTKVNGLKKTKELTKKDLKKITYFIQKHLLIDEELKKKERSFLKNLAKKKTYRGFRHQSNLPVRGQRTSRNAKTQKMLRRSRFLK